MAHSNVPIPATESYWILVDKADRKFSKIRDLPYYERSRYDASFNKVFKVYTQLWKFQQENRQKLVDAGLKRWQIGEIASRIGQLYFGQYMRTSDASFLSESYIFYEAILSREYFKEGLLDDINVANKQLRFLARFLMVCLVLNQREVLALLVNQLKALVDDCTKSFQDCDFKEWKGVVHEIVRFLQADTGFMNARPLRYSHMLDPHQDFLSHVAAREERSLKLRDAVLCSYHPNEVKFSELTIDTFRMLQCLEWEPSGSLHPSQVLSGNNDSTYQKGAAGFRHISFSHKIADLTLPPNPRKAILYRPSATHLIAVLAMICEELPIDGIVLVYLSNSGRVASITSATNRTNNDSCKSSLRSFQSDKTHCEFSRTSSFSSLSLSDSSNQTSDHLHIAPAGRGGLSCIFPSDIIPFTRRPLFLVIDSDSSKEFKAISENEKGEQAAMLLSSGLPLTGTITGFSNCESGSLFTMFLTAPLQAFCLLLGFSDSNINMVLYSEAVQVLSTSFTDWGSVLNASYTLDGAWVQILGDPFLQRLLLRFIFCRAVLAHYAPTFNRKGCLPRCRPHLPESLLPTSSTCRTIMMQLASIFGVSSSFIFS